MKKIKSIRFKKPDFSNLSRRRKVLLALLVVAILAVCAALGLYAWNAYENTKDKTSQSTQLSSEQVQLLVESDMSETNCNNGLEQAKDQQLNPEQPASSIALLSFKFKCQNYLGRYQEAVVTLKELKDYYLKNGEVARAEALNARIADMENYAANPPKNGSTKEPTPQLKGDLGNLRESQ